MTRPRLLILASTFPGRADDGTPAFVRDLALEEAADFETLVIVPAVPGAPAAERVGTFEVRRFRFFFKRWEDLAEGAILENLRSRPSRWLQVAPFLAAEWIAIRRHARQFRPDVMHVHWIIPQGLAALGVASRVPMLLTTLGGDLYGLRSRAMRMLKRSVIRRAARLTAMNEDMRDQLVALGARAEDVSVLPMGADLTGIRVAAAGIEREPGRLLFVGRLVEKKGLEHLLEALRAMADVRCTLTVVGDGPLRQRLERQARGLPVEFTGQLGRLDLAVQYARSAVVVVPSARAASGDQDGLPVALLEAMGLGCAVVASNLPGLNEVVLPGRTGLLVPPGDSIALAGALRQVLSDPAERRRLGEEAQDLAESLSLESVGARYRTLLKELVSALVVGRGITGGGN